MRCYTIQPFCKAKGTSGDISQPQPLPLSPTPRLQRPRSHEAGSHCSILAHGDPEGQISQLQPLVRWYLDGVCWVGDAGDGHWPSLQPCEEQWGGVMSQVGTLSSHQHCLYRTPFVGLFHLSCEHHESSVYYISKSLINA